MPIYIIVGSGKTTFLDILTGRRKSDSTIVSIHLHVVSSIGSNLQSNVTLWTVSVCGQLTNPV